MQMLSITGFKKMCEKISPATFIFDTENQPWVSDRHLKMVARYSEMICMLNPNRICFKNNHDTLCLNRVKAIRYHDDDESVGETFSIICGNSKTDNVDVSYVIVADKK